MRILTAINLQVGFALLLSANCFAQQGPATLWSRTYSIGSGESKDLAVLSNGNIVVAGYKPVAGASWDVFALCLAPDGDSLWLQTYGTPHEEYASLIRPTNTGGFSISAWQFAVLPDSQEIFIVNASASGEFIWDGVYGGYSGTNCHDALPDGGFTICGNLHGDVFVARLDDSGDTVWTNTFDFCDGGKMESVRSTEGGSLICAGHGQNPLHGGNIDAFLLKVTSNGDLEFVHWYGGNGRDWGRDVAEILGEGYLAVGQSEIPHWASFLVRTDLNGDTLWTRTVELGSYSVLHRVIRVSDGFIVTGNARTEGNSSYDLILARFDDSGNLVWINRYPGIPVWFTSTGLAAMENGSYVACASLQGNASPFVVRTVPDTAVFVRWSEHGEIAADFQLSAYPNPFNSTTEITFEMPRASRAVLKVYDLLGRERVTLLDGLAQSGTTTVRWDAGEFASGIYFVRLAAGEEMVTEKVVLVK